MTLARDSVVSGSGAESPALTVPAAVGVERAASLSPVSDPSS